MIEKHIQTNIHTLNTEVYNFQYGDVIDIGDTTKYMVIEDEYGDYPVLILRLKDMKITNGFSCLEDLNLEMSIRSASRDYVLTITCEGGN